MNIQDLKIEPAQMRNLILAILNVPHEDKKPKAKENNKHNMKTKGTDSVKDEAKYKALRREGDSKEKAARIANTPNASQKGGKATALDERTKTELLAEAKKIGIKGRHKMSKKALIDAIRNH